MSGDRAANAPSAPRARASVATQATRLLALAGTIGFAVAIALALLTGCGSGLTAAVSLKVDRSPDTPRDASVVIDEQYIGPLGIVAAHGVRLPVGEHRISVEKNGFFPFDKLVEADRDDIVLHVKLEPVPD
ncbi:MAG TPA: PEGA domain-containing protein [Polyangiaceae bacterium]|nr:PEGA domain-containing protein [Polyangiaceae bacterium]